MIPVLYSIDWNQVSVNGIILGEVNRCPTEADSRRIARCHNTRSELCPGMRVDISVIYEFEYPRICPLLLSDIRALSTKASTIKYCNS